MLKHNTGEAPSITLFSCRHGVLIVRGRADVSLLLSISVSFASMSEDRPFKRPFQWRQVGQTRLSRLWLQSLWLTVARRAPMNRPHMQLRGLVHGFAPAMRPLCLGPDSPGRSRSPQLPGVGPPEPPCVRLVVASGTVMGQAGQAACSCGPRAGARGGARACNPRCVRIFSITGCSRIAAMIFSAPPQFGQCSRSISKAKLQRRLTCTQVMS